MSKADITKKHQEKSLSRDWFGVSFPCCHWGIGWRLGWGLSLFFCALLTSLLSLLPWTSNIRGPLSAALYPHAVY